MADDEIGVALSGGGFRATLFGLGVLNYLVDAGHNRDIAAVSSVSGGSYASAYVAHALAEEGHSLATAQPEHFDPAVLSLLERLTTRPVWANRRFGRLAALVAGIPLVGLAAKRALPRHWDVARGAVNFSMLFGLSAASQSRGDVISDSIWEILFDGASPMLDETQKSIASGDRPVDHVFCATNLHDGRFVYISPRFVYSRSLGWGLPHRQASQGRTVSLRLRDAVDASSALPIIFPSKLITGEVFDDAKKPTTPREVHLADGGVYDNLGEQWFRTVSSRLSEKERKLYDIAKPKMLIVANARADLKPRKWIPGSTLPITRVKIRVFAGFAAIRRVFSILQHNSTVRDSARLARQFKEAFDKQEEAVAAGLEPSGPGSIASKIQQYPEERETALAEGVRGSFVGIGSTPFKVPNAVLAGLPDHRVLGEPGPQSPAVTRAIEVRKRLLQLNLNWHNLSRLNLEVPSRPRQLTDQEVVRLMYQGYVTTWANMRTLWDFATPPEGIPTLSEYGRRWSRDGVSADLV